MSQYESLAPVYDSLTPDVDYAAFADFYEKIFNLYHIAPSMVMDLACGTGTLTCLMAERGYEMIGIDASAEMLSEARIKADSLSCDISPIFVNQSLEELDMYGTSDAAVCCLDGMNYVHPEDLPEVFRRLNLFIRPGGVLIFDINSPEKLRSLDGEMYIDETDETYCVWRTEFDEEENACFYGMDIFTLAEDDRWERSFEEHIEYAHTTKMLTEMLKNAGFSDIRIFGELTLDAPTEGEQRIFISAENRRENG